jgi:ribosomal protein L23
MNKPEIREYLTKIYNLPVKKVMTANFLGETICLYMHASLGNRAAGRGVVLIDRKCSVVMRPYML